MKLENYFMILKKIRFWTLNGMIPRSLNFAINVIKENQSEIFDDKNLDTLFYKVENFLLMKYEIIIDDIFLFYLISGAKVGWNKERSKI
jgi:hypothetical protein